MTGWQIRWQIRSMRARFPWMSDHLLAIRAGLSVAAVRRLEAGKTRTLNLDTLRRLCLALECTPGDLLAFHPEPALAGSACANPRAALRRPVDITTAA